MPHINILDSDIRALPEDMLKEISVLEDDPIETISQALARYLKYDTVIQIEPEFLVMQLSRMLDKKISEQLTEKIYATIAILVNPLEVTSDLSAFINTVMVCNDEPAIPYDGEIVPSRFLPRTMDAISKILAPWGYEKHFRNCYLHSNIQKYIFECYVRESCYLLDKDFIYMEQQFLDNIGNLETTKPLRDAMADLRELDSMLDAAIDEHESVIREQIKAGEETAVDKMFDDLEKDPRLPEQYFSILAKSMVNHLYTHFYDIIQKGLDSDLIKK